MMIRKAGIGAVLIAAITLSLSAQNTGQAVDVVAGGKAYVSYLTAPQTPGRKPAILLIHSFNGLEQGYKDMADRMAADGVVVLAVGWQTFEKSPADETVSQVVASGLSLLKGRPDVDQSRIGLTGFCAGGRYTELFLPVMKDFKAGVAWYGFPYNGGSGTQPVKPAEEIDMLQSPLLMIHGSADQASPIARTFEYAAALEQAKKYFELKVYQGLPHGFMVQNGQLWWTDKGQDAYREMMGFFKRMLG
jgi:carboxymethylenebutenolidase